MRIALTNGLVGEGCALYRAVVDTGLEGIVAKRLMDDYHPKLARRMVSRVSGTQNAGTVNFPKREMRQ